MQLNPENIIPRPKKIICFDEYLKLTENIRISSEKSDETKFVTERLQKIQNFLKSESFSGEDENAELLIELIIDKNLEELSSLSGDISDQGYVLEIKADKIIIKSTNASGLFYGVMTVEQIIENSEKGKIKCCKIIDWPDLAIRGISDDISRGQVSTMDNFKKILDFMARYKMNLYMPYIEDVFSFARYPDIGAGRGALNKDEALELVDYAKKLNIEIIPIFQTLGHYENILLLDNFIKYAEFPGAASLDVSNEEIYTFVENMLMEIFEAFPGEYIHVGADESYDVGQGNSKHLVENSSIADVHAEHYRRIYDICKKHGRKMIMYGDIILHHPEILEKIPKDILIVDWHYGPARNYKSVKTFTEAGFDIFVSPSVWNFITSYPTNINAFPNIYYLTKNGVDNQVKGMVNSNWGDFGAETFKELNYHGYAWSAQCAWNIEGSEPGNFSRNFYNDFFGVRLDYAAGLSREMSDVFNQFGWQEFWRHPLLEFRNPYWWESKLSRSARLSWMEWSNDDIDRSINEIETSARRNKDHAEILRFLTKMNKWFADKLEFQYELGFIEDSLVTDPGTAVSSAEKLTNELGVLKMEYGKLWKEYYREDNLHMIMDKFERLTSYLEEIKSALQNGELYDPKIKSEWIYYPSDEDELVKSAEFSKNFTLENVPGKAFAHFMGDTHAKLKINGEQISEIYARRTLSLVVEYGRIRMIDITGNLREGENKIEVEANNYYGKGEAGFNLYIQCGEGEQMIEVCSDSTWNVKKLPGSEDDKKVKARAEEYRFEVIAPDFERGRSGWIER